MDSKERNMFDTTQPRVTVTSPYRDSIGDCTSFELEQGCCWGEIVFWLKLGYTCEFYRWDGQSFKRDQSFTAADL